MPLKCLRPSLWWRSFPAQCLPRIRLWTERQGLAVWADRRARPSGSNLTLGALA
jgi:hypothetical protein